MFPSYVQIIHSPEPIKLDVRDKAAGETKEVSLVEYVCKMCPSLVPGAYFFPTPYLWNGHLQTAYAAYENFEYEFNVSYERYV